MTNDELAAKYERDHYIDISWDMEGDELKQVIAALRSVPEALRIRICDACDARYYSGYLCDGCGVTMVDEPLPQQPSK